MTVPILCLVSLCLLMWVLILKAEISQLRGKDPSAPSPTDRLTRITPVRERAKGMRSFDLGAK